MKKPIYITLNTLPKGHKLFTFQGEFILHDLDNTTGKLIGIEILDYQKLEIDGKEIK